MKPKPRQRKRPGAEPLGSDFGKNIAHLRRLRPAPVAKAIADDLVREQEELRAQLAKARGDRDQFSADLQSMRDGLYADESMLDALSHALDRANDLWTIENRLFHMVNHQKEQAEARIAELTAQFEHMRDGRDNLQVERDGMLERIARLTADLEFERGVNKITTGTLCLSAQNEVGLATQIRSQQKELESLRQTPATTSGNQWLQAGFAVLTTQAEPERPKRKPWYRRSFTELFRRGGA